MKKSEDAYLLSWAKKLKAIESLGGGCYKCGTDDPLLLTFHHEFDKSHDIELSQRWSIIETELKKCKLLCRNCHCEIHYKASRNALKKAEVISLLGFSKCSECGYSGENYASLHFHHRNPKDKSFGINESVIRKKNVLVEEFYEEVSKCSVICANCHCKHHFNYEKFRNNYDKIVEKYKLYKEEKLPTNIEIILSMIRNGKKQCEICKDLSLPKSTVGTIVAKIKRKNLLQT